MATRPRIMRRSKIKLELSGFIVEDVQCDGVSECGVSHARAYPEDVDVCICVLNAADSTYG